MPKLTPIMGPGCGNKELESCPPSFHVELTAEELMDAIRDPAAAAKRLGMESGLTSVHVSLPPNNANAATGTSVLNKPTTIYCCVKCLTSSLCCQAWPA